MPATIENCENIEVAFTQEKFDAAVRRASIARQNLAGARGNHRAAEQFLDEAEEEARRAKSDLQKLAWSAAGFGPFG